VPRPPVPGEATVDPVYARHVVMVRNVTLRTLTNEIHVDAMIDTGATFCVVPPSIARVLNFDSSNRLWQRAVSVVGGQVMMDMHRLESVKVGSARAYSVMFGVHDTFPKSRTVLIGLPFIRQFRTTFDFDENRVLFRSRSS
jgi:predicted aspartyl protease